MADYVERRSRESHWKVLDKEIKLEKKLLSASAEGAKVVAFYDVHLRFTLDYPSPEEAPALKGRLRWLRKHENELSPAALEKAREEIAMWRRDLAEYISTPQDAYERLMVEAL